ncbi:MAG TPA: 5-(carboxyamino)imidazole ribonucleotide synthase [Acidimicrobiia bacterium]|nr:5-(carboxyamino)imidazole ribonucleotide synthase [Acidimicrobiia bacterium]
MTQVTVLGGGQLGRMLGLAGLPLGIQFQFLDPVDGAPAEIAGPVVVGALDDLAAASEAAVGADVVTFEWEGVPAATAEHIAAKVPVYPPPRALDVAQDRVTEKQTCNDLGIATAPWRAVDDRAGLTQAVSEIGLPAVLKTRRGGYDGKGQAVLRDEADLDRSWRAVGEVPSILEGFVPFTRELSVLAVRGRDGTAACWPVNENEHRDGVLRVTRAPARGLTPELQARAEACIVPLLADLDYVGVLCVELFDVDGELLANEIAPRVHNSGHWTIEGAQASQFENHVRAVLGWPLGSTAARGVNAMVNCIGAMPDRDTILAIPGAHLHDYGKTPRAGRKVGHVTITATTDDEREQLLGRVCNVVESA